MPTLVVISLHAHMQFNITDVLKKFMNTHTEVLCQYTHIFVPVVVIVPVNEHILDECIT